MSAEPLSNTTFLEELEVGQLHSQQPNQLVLGDDVVELLPQDVPLVLLVLDAHVLPVHGVDDSQVVNETRLRAQSQVQLSAPGLEGQNMDRFCVFACWAAAPQGVSTQHTDEY